MKRFIAALSSVLTILLAGTAAAHVPVRHRVPARAPTNVASPAGPAVVAPTSSGDLLGVPDAGQLPGLPEPVEGLEDLVMAGLPGLPDAVADMLGAPEMAGKTVAPGVMAPVEPVEPAGQAVPILPAPAGEERSAQPQSAPAAPKKAERRAAALKPVLPAAQVGDVFPGLPATGHAGYAAGHVIYLAALQAAATTVARAEVAFSGATFTNSPLTEAVTNEMGRLVSPTLPAGAGYGRGTGLELGIVVPTGGQNQVVLPSLVEAKSPPSTALVTDEELNVAIPAAAAASVLRGQAQSRANAACTTDVDLSYGLGYAADVGLIGAATDFVVETTTTDPLRAVSQSTSRTRLVPQAGMPVGPIAKFGLMSETRQTIAPVTFFDGDPLNEFSIEFGGEFVLRATADGKSGSVFYGPGTVEPETPLVTIKQRDAIVEQITSQELFGEQGLTVTIPNIATIHIGEDPRDLGGAELSEPTETATFAAGAVDVVRVTLLNAAPALQGAEVRIGHLETAVAVPAGGIECGIGIVKRAIPELVRPGQEFIWIVTVSNPNDCILTSVKLVDTISTTPGIKYTIVGSEPRANSTTANSLTWNDIGPINPGQSKEVTIRVLVAPDSAGGRFTDEAVATGVCGPAAGTAGAGVGVPLEARVTLNLPEVIVVVPARAELPRTGGLATALPALVLLTGGLVIRRTMRRAR